MSSQTGSTDGRWIDRRDHYLTMAREISDVIQLTTKDGWFWRAAAWGLFLLSCGRVKRRHFLEDFASTLGPWQAYPKHWERISPVLIAHEGRHVQQYLFAGWFVPVVGWLGRRVRVWAGLLPTALIYALFPLPVFLAWGRFRLELDAESYGWKRGLEQGWMTADEVRSRARRCARLVSSWEYFKAWPSRWTMRAFERRAEQIIGETFVPPLTTSIGLSSRQ